MNSYASIAWQFLYSTVIELKMIVVLICTTCTILYDALDKLYNNKKKNQTCRITESRFEDRRTLLFIPLLVGL